VFENGGFSCVLGNPPWERIKLQEKEFFATKDSAIANAKNKAARTKLINKLAITNPQLLAEFEDAKHDADATSKFLRESDRCPLTSRGDINTYSVFAETTRNLISPTGRVGIIVPTGIATDNSTKEFIQELVNSNLLVSFYDFTNQESIFIGVERNISFALLTISNKLHNSNMVFASKLRRVIDINNNERIYKLNKKNLASVNPNTLNIPIFSTSKDAKIIIKIHQNVPVLDNHQLNENQWNILLSSMFHMSSDSSLFKSKLELENGGYVLEQNYFKNDKNVFLPLYESKLTDIFNHRASTFDNISQKDMFVAHSRTNKAILQQLINPDWNILPRYWVEKKIVDSKIPNFWKYSWLIGFRDIVSAVADSRSTRLTIIPRVAVGNTISLIFPQKEAKLIPVLIANFNSLILDYIAKNKISGSHLNFYIVKQLPVIPPETYTEEDIKFISTRVLELVYTAWDMQPFAKDMGYDGEPFIWDEQRRAILRAELDAYYAKLYGLTRDELRYILDPADVYGEDFPSETSRVLKNKEINQYGEYRTQRLVLAAWDRMFG
jgi:hypothetical protein